MAKLNGFEGMDGAGKTSIAKGIADRNDQYGYLYFTDGNPFAELRSIADRQDPQIRFYYYLAMNLVNYTRFNRMKQEDGKDILLDRTPISTVVYYANMGVNTKPYNLFHRRFMEQFDNMVYVHASGEAIRSRVVGRAGKDGVQKYDQYSMDQSEVLHRAFLAWLPFNSSTIDTSDLTIDDAIDVALNTIKHE